MRIAYPADDNIWLDVPDTFLGLHATRYDQANDQAEGQGRTLKTFACAVSLLDDWNIPALSGPPEKWDFERLELSLILWVNQTVIGRYMECYKVPKNYSAPSPNGQTAQANGQALGKLENSQLIPV